MTKSIAIVCGILVSAVGALAVYLTIPSPPIVPQGSITRATDNREDSIRSGPQERNDNVRPRLAMTDERDLMSSPPLRHIESRKIDYFTTDFVSAWHSQDQARVEAAEQLLIRALQHGDEQSIYNLLARIDDADVELQFKAMKLLTKVGTDFAFEALGNFAKDHSSPKRRTAALAAIEDVDAPFSGRVTKCVEAQIRDALAQQDPSLTLAFGRSLAKGAPNQAVSDLLELADAPSLEGPLSTAIMQAVENARSPQLVSYISHFLDRDANLTTNAAIATGNALANVPDKSAYASLIRWAENADFDRVADQAKYWFALVAQNSEGKSELRTVKQFGSFRDQRMAELIYQIATERKQELP